MISYSSTKKVESKSVPGVSFTVRVISEGFRTKILMGLIDTMAEIRQYQTDLTKLNDALPRNEKGDVDAVKAAGTDTLVELQNLTDKILVLRKNKVNPVYAREGFVKLTGMAIDGDEDPSIDVVCERGPERLYNEIIEVIREEIELSEEQKQNLESPTTSGALVEEAKSSMIAPFVEIMDSTPSETAIDTFLKT